MDRTTAPEQRNNKSLASLNVKEILLYISITLMPAFVLTSFQAYNDTHIFIISSVFFGIILGIVALLLCRFLIPNALKGNYIPKILSMLTPAVLLFSFNVDLQNSTMFYCVFFIAFFVMLYFAFVFPLKDVGKHVCAAIILLSMLFAVEYSLFVYDLFSPDSFSYYDISNTIFSNFYNVATQRQYIVDTELGISFPYLFPTLTAVFNIFIGLKIYAGTILNVVVACISALMLYKISTKHFHNPYAGTIAAVFMLTNDPYLTEMRVARSVPLTVLFILVLIYYILDLPKLSTKACVLAGVGAGAAMVCRFDAFIAAGLCLVVIFIFSCKGGRIKSSLKYAGGLIIPTAPWIIFSLVNFGKLWISDNGGTMWMITPSVPQRYYSSSYTLPTIFNSFDEWLSALFNYKLNGMLQSAIPKCVPLVVALILIAWAVVMLLRFVKCGQIKLYFRSHKKLIVSACVCVFIYLAKFCGIWIVGFTDARYHSESFIMLVLFLAAVVYSISAFTKSVQKSKPTRTGNKKSKNIKSESVASSAKYAENYEKTSKSLVVNISTALACITLIAFTGSDNINRYSPLIMSESYLTKPYAATVIESAVTTKTAAPRVFFCHINEGDPFSFGAYTGIRTFTPPWTKSNDPNALIEITDNYIMPDYVVCKSTTLRDDFAQRYGFVAVYEYYDSLTVYEVTNKSTFAAEAKLFPYKN